MPQPGKILNRLSWATDLPDEPIPGQFLVEIVGDQRVLIENHIGVTEYSDETVCAKVKNGAICVCGSHLELSRMTKTQLIISGTIQSVQLKRG